MRYGRRLSDFPSENPTFLFSKIEKLQAILLGAIGARNLPAAEFLSEFHSFKSQRIAHNAEA